MMRQQTKVSDTQEQLSTGRRILAPSDDPAAAARVLNYNQAIANVEQYQDNVGRARSRLEQEESLLSGVGDALIRAKELAVQGNSDSLNVDNKKALAAEVNELLDHIYGIANTRDASGDYIFAGYQSGSQPFTRPNNSTFTYQGDMGRRQLQISSDRMIADGDNGYDVFVDIETSSGKRNMFETLYQLATALENDQPVGSFIDDIGMALDSVLETRTTIGARINALDDQERVNDGVKLILQTHLSDEADLDYNEAITRLNQQSLVLQAAQQTYTEVKGLSLFNYL